MKVILRENVASLGKSGELVEVRNGYGRNFLLPRKMAEAYANIAAQLSFREAQTALELSLAELQAPELDVEEMAGLYRRASRYAQRCEQLLQQVEQEVMQWDPAQPEQSPEPFSQS